MREMKLEEFIIISKKVVGRNRGLQARDFECEHADRLANEFECWLKCTRVTKMHNAVFKVSYSSELDEWAVGQYNYSSFQVRK